MATLISQSCSHCGNQFSHGRRKKYCGSDDCLRSRRSQKQRKVVRVFHPAHDCPVCGTEIPARDSMGPKQYCKDSCRQIARNRAKGINPKPESTPNYTPVHCKSCAVCSSLYVTKSSWTKYCRRCVETYGQYWCMAVVRSMCETACLSCGASFSRLPLSRHRFCSDLCASEALRKKKRAEKSRRRCKVRAGETFDPFEVFERDGWQCRACSKPTPKSRRGSVHHAAPELDHIVPLSMGGEHTKRNTQCLCRECNQRKGANVEGAQMLLV